MFCVPISGLLGYIDKGIPVIAWGPHPTAVVGMFVGYEEYGKTLLYITGNKNEPERISFEAAFSNNPEYLDKQHSLESVMDILLPKGDALQGGWVFVGDKFKTARLQTFTAMPCKAHLQL